MSHALTRRGYCAAGWREWEASLRTFGCILRRPPAERCPLRAPHTLRPPAPRAALQRGWLPRARAGAVLVHLARVRLTLVCLALTPLTRSFGSLSLLARGACRPGYQGQAARGVAAGPAAGSTAGGRPHLAAAPVRVIHPHAGLVPPVGRHAGSQPTGGGVRVRAPRKSAKTTRARQILRMRPPRFLRKPVARRKSVAARPPLLRSHCRREQYTDLPPQTAEDRRVLPRSSNVASSCSAALHAERAGGAVPSSDTDVIASRESSQRVRWRALSAALRG